MAVSTVLEHLNPLTLVQCLATLSIVPGVQRCSRNGMLFQTNSMFLLLTLRHSVLFETFDLIHSRFKAMEIIMPGINWMGC